jgi:hypothetical protein
MATPTHPRIGLADDTKNHGGIAAAQHKKIVEDNPRAFDGLA